MGTAGDPGTIVNPRISPDQKSVVFFESHGAVSDIWLFDAERGNTTRLTSSLDMAYYPVWSPDGSRIAYATRQSSRHVVVERPSSGIGKETILYYPDSVSYTQSWSRDGRWLLLVDVPGSFYLLPMGPEGSGGERKPVPFPQSPAEGRHPSISPDGRWLLYSSTQTGRREVFVESMPEQMGGPVAGFKRMISNSGGMQPAWRADGEEIFYVAADGKMMSVSVDPGGASLKLTLPKPLFKTRLELDSFFRQYDVSADGKRFLFAEPLEDSASVPITVIVNWPELLKKEAGAL